MQEAQRRKDAKFTGLLGGLFSHRVVIDCGYFVFNACGATKYGNFD